MTQKEFERLQPGDKASWNGYRVNVSDKDMQRGTVTFYVPITMPYLAVKVKQPRKKGTLK